MIILPVKDLPIKQIRRLTVEWDRISARVDVMCSHPDITHFEIALLAGQISVQYLAAILQSNQGLVRRDGGKNVSEDCVDPEVENAEKSEN